MKQPRGGMSPGRRDRAATGKDMITMRDHRRTLSSGRRTAAVLGLVAALCAALLLSTSAAQATAQETHHLVASGSGWQVWHGTDSYSFACPVDDVCLWTGTNYTGYAVFFTGVYQECRGWRFEGSVFQDHTYSIWNRMINPISIWNRHSDGSYNYDKYGQLPWNYLWGSTPFSYIMDGWAYDPYNRCTNPPNVWGHLTWQP
jgi:hypothetical protein